MCATYPSECQLGISLAIFSPSRVLCFFAPSKHLRHGLQDLAFLIKAAFGPLATQSDRGFSTTLSDCSKYFTDTIHYFFLEID